MAQLSWLPETPDWRPALRAVAAAGAGGWPQAQALANTRLDFVRTGQLDQTLRRCLGEAVPKDLGTKPVRLAILGSCTLAQLHAGIRVAGLRRGIHVAVHENDYGQYWQELTDTGSALHAFRPNTVLLALDGAHLSAGVDAGMEAGQMEAALDEALGRIRACWQAARAAFGCHVIHQVPLATATALMGQNEHRLPGSRLAFVRRLCAALRPMADAEGVDLLALDEHEGGLAAWHDPQLWLRAKQEVSPLAAPLYGELVGRLIAAKQGRSYKCLVLDLDHTLWGGVVGDDGVEGLVLGQGSPLGEAFAAFQDYARELSRRGVILAVCSKNDEATALEPFEKHPEMVLRRGDIACFVANWSNKADNLRTIAAELNIGLDSLVFVDDNPFERNLVRAELPMVAVPEVGDDPAQYGAIVSAAGYFEALAVTAEDRARGAQYQENRQREVLRSTATDLPAYLRGLGMVLTHRRFDAIGLQRTVQLINKTNQFNLTTRRYTEDDVLGVMRDARAFGLQLRLVDRFGDNGIIAIVIGRMQEDDDLLIDTWLMSCRVLGRQVEPTTLNLIVAQARALGALRLVGEYVATKKNAMVRDHYARLGFSPAVGDVPDTDRYVLDLSGFAAADTFIDVREG